ncbi:MAG: radical SAM protein [Deltaproteobacteria bacterium]|nr:radical SAM protein [Deltaproteobacteria bacterium]
MANIGYIQVVRHCNHFCGFCSNPTSPYVHTRETLRALVDDLVARDYYGVVLTGGEPTLHPELPETIGYAKSRGLHVRMITNGSRLAQPDFARAVAEAGLDLVHVSVYSVRPEVEARLRGTDDTLGRAFAAIENAADHGVAVNVNCVINKLNADHLDENVRYFIEHHPRVRHFVWNNLDPSMGRAEVNQALFLHRLTDMRDSLFRALRLLHATARTFRVERVPLCFMPEFAWASTETRKIVKGEERIVHFLDQKQTVRQTEWDHIYAEGCPECSLRPICGGLFERGDAFDPAELVPLRVPLRPIAEAVIGDPSDPSYPLRSFEEWEPDFLRRLEEAKSLPRLDTSGELPPPEMRPDAPPVGQVTDRSAARYRREMETVARRARSSGVAPERPHRLHVIDD